MGAKRIAERLQARNSQAGCAVIPYFTAGLPDSATLTELIRAADRLGAPVVEIGFPFSDSVADGTVIQASFHRALERGYRIDETIQLIRAVRPVATSALVAMLSHSLVFRRGIAPFLARMSEAGFDGIIVPDVPVEESNCLRTEAERVGLAYIGLIAPRTSDERIARTAATSSGFMYVVAAAGTTGERAELPTGLSERVQRIRGATALPICAGFGISTRAQVEAVCRICDGVIVGSALVRRISEAVSSGMSSEEIVRGIEAFLGELMGSGNIPKARS